MGEARPTTSRTSTWRATTPPSPLPSRPRPGALVRFRPATDSDLALAVGLRSGVGWNPPTAELPLDALRLPDGLACNLAVVGTAPDRLGWATGEVAIEVAVDGEPWFAGQATTVVVANGQFLRGADLVPRGHPGDGRAEVQVYALRRRRTARDARAPGDRNPPAAPPDPHAQWPDRRDPGRRACWRWRSTASLDRRCASSTPRSSRGPSGSSCSHHRHPLRRGFAAGSINRPCCTRRSTSRTTKRRRSGRISRTSTVPSSRSINLPEVVKGALFAAVLAFRQEPAPALPRRVRRRPRSHGRPDGRRHRRAAPRRGAVRARVLRVRRRLRRPARRRAPRVRAGVEPPHQGARVGPADVVPRAVDALHPVRLAHQRPLPLRPSVGGVRVAARHALRRRPRRPVRHVPRARCPR